MNFDWTILNFIQDNIRCNALDKIMPVITHLCSGGLIWIIITIVLLIIKKQRKTGIMLAIGLLLGVLIGNLLLKNIIQRSRPCWINENILLLVKRPNDFSFPSGHTLSSTIAATLLALNKSKISFFAIPTALIIAFSRLYLFVHFPTDILGGMLLGGTIAVIVFLSYKLIEKKYRLKADKK